MKSDQQVFAPRAKRLRIFSAIARISDPAELAEMAATAAAEWTGASFGLCFLREPGITGLSKALLQAVEGCGAKVTLRPTLQEADTFLSDDIRIDPRFCGMPLLLGLPDGLPAPASFLCVPIASPDGDVHGCIAVLHERPAAFAGEEDEIAAAVAGQVAIAIDHARLMEVARRGAEARGRVEQDNAWFASIVENSDDAILSKSLTGDISSWNAGATRLFGYTEQEAVGRHVTILIPEDRLHEEADILGRIRRGERVQHYETVRRRKDGSFLDISLTVSPVRDAQGIIIGASKIARDISERKRAQERQSLLLREMNHRVKNLFSVTTGLISVSALTAQDTDELATSLRERVLALSRAHDLTLPDLGREITGQGGTTLFALLAAIVAPHDFAAASRLELTGVDVPLSGSTLTSLALLLHEFTTNAAKYGALSTGRGRVAVRTAIEGETLLLNWAEQGGPAVDPGGSGEGFGSLLERLTVQGLGGEIARDWAPEGVVIRLEMPLAQLSG
ncbi:PAS domain S-box protein [Roseococcus pinisoli]|nr:PAS domain S-box protein [Roseococcus pinisoli]